MFETTSKGSGVLPNGCLVQPGGEVWFPIGHSLPPELLRSGQRVALPPSVFQRGAPFHQNNVSLQTVQTSPYAFSGQGSYSSSQKIEVHQNEFGLQRSQMRQPLFVPTPEQCPMQHPLYVPTPVQCPMQQPLYVPTPVQCPMQQPLYVPSPVQCPMQQPLDVPINVQCPMQQQVEVPIHAQYPTQKPLDVQINVKCPMQQPLDDPINVQCPMQQPLNVPINVQCPMQQPLDDPINVQCPMQQPLYVQSNAQCPMQQPLDVQTKVQCPMQQPLDLSSHQIQIPGQHITKQHVRTDVPKVQKSAAESTLQVYSGYLPHCDPNEILAVKLDPKVKPVFPKMVNPACHPACVDLNWGEMDDLLESAVITCQTPASDNTSAVFSLDDLVDMLSETRDNKLDSGAEGLTEGGLSAFLTTGVSSPAFVPITPAVPVDSSKAQMTNISCQPKKRQRQPNKRRVPTARVKPQPQKRKLVSDDLKSQSLMGSPEKPECFITHVDKDDDIEPHPKQRKVDSDDLKCSSLSMCPANPDCSIIRVDNVDDIYEVPAQANHEVKVIRKGQQPEEVKESRDEDAMDTRDDDGHLTFKIPQALRRLFC